MAQKTQELHAVSQVAPATLAPVGSSKDARHEKRVLSSKPTAAKSRVGSVQVGAGSWNGNATYSIGGNAWTPETGSVRLPDKLSELKFPLDVAYGTVGGTMVWNGRVEIFGSFMGNLTDTSSKMEDSDWGVFSEDPDRLDIYSESDAELTAVAVDVGGRYWLRSLDSTNRVVWSVGVGPALLYQRYDWTISNVDQGYPSQPGLAHDIVAGEVATYNVDVVMPYFNACAIVKFKRLSGRAEAGLGLVLVRDEDDHVLRQKRSTADMAGIGAKGALEFRYDLTRHLFTLARVSILAVEATGTSTDEGYGGDMAGFYAEVDEDFSLISVNSGLAVGYNF
jgi:hypothetical protein